MGTKFHGAQISLGPKNQGAQMKSGTISALACPCTPSSATSGLQRETGQSFSRKSNYKSLASAELVLLRTWKFSRVYTNSKRVQGTLRGGGGDGGTAQQAAAMHRSDALYLLALWLQSMYVLTYVYVCGSQSAAACMYEWHTAVGTRSSHSYM